MFKESHIQALYVNFFAFNRKISSIKIYINEGTIVKIAIINNWLQQKKSLEGTLLLFELTMDDNVGIHTYSFLDTTTDVTTLINNAIDK